MTEQPLEPNFELVHPEKRRSKAPKPDKLSRQQRKLAKSAKRRRKWPWLIGLLLLVVIGAAGFYIYLYGVPQNLQFWQTAATESVGEEIASESEEKDEPDEAKVAPATYSNPEAGFEFQYPAAWGEVVVSTEPFAQGESGEFLFGAFRDVALARFGGAAFGYTTLPRGGSHLDRTGYVRVEDGYYTLYASGALNPQKIEGAKAGSFQLVEGENTVSLLYVSAESEVLETAVIGLVNLEGSRYPGLAFVVPVGDDEAAAVANMKELLESLKLIKAE